MVTGTSITHIPSATAANIDLTSDSVDVLLYTSGSFEIVAASCNNLDGTIKVQESNDNTNFSDYAAATTINANGAFTIKMTQLTKRYIRTVYTHGTNTLGSIKGIFVLKG